MNKINLSSYITIPSNSKSVGIIVIQEWWGVDDHIKNLTIKFAENGFTAIAPDLYHGQITNEPDEAQKLAMNININNALSEIKESIQLLKKICSKVVVVGFCMGGLVALKVAENINLDGVFAFYPSRYDPTVADVKKNASDVYIFYGDKDHGYDKNKYEKIEKKFKDNNFKKLFKL